MREASRATRYAATIGGMPGPRPLDVSVPSPPRMYDYLLGGSDHFSADREAVQRILQVVPNARQLARANRSFLLQTVRDMARQGIGQFVDLGAGIPFGRTVHGEARSVIPPARVLYVDVDPIACTHWQALLVSDEGTAAVMADIADTEAILAHPELGRLVDFSEPVGVLFAAVLPYLGDTEAQSAVAAFRQHMAPGSMLAVTHAVPGQAPLAVIGAVQDVRLGRCAVPLPGGRRGPRVLRGSQPGAARSAPPDRTR